MLPNEPSIKFSHCEASRQIVLVRLKFSFVIFTSLVEATRGLFWDNLVILKPDPMTPPKPARPSLNFRATPEGGHSAPTDLMCTRPANTAVFDGIGGFEPGTLWPQSRDSTANPPGPSD
ncbi:hypothetical protein AVEN_228760-1 [Araneus ventricosus]|uniref:Uncharacterized protein n=1 Tax=Araneus ventricosus TaxID=182803 RepID=A0A4Y2GLF0_ARAVE|nr:hypothetical protein AVEN_228760-1 [Araneus ventricosus]